MKHLNKFITMANIIPKNPESFKHSLIKVIDFIDIIKKLDIDASIPMYDKHWIKLKLRKDKSDQNDKLDFIKQRMTDSFFLVNRVVKS